ncbi:hypothetical protein ES705_41408 [subsurface metagenome]
MTNLFREIKSRGVEQWSARVGAFPLGRRFESDPRNQIQ